MQPPSHRSLPLLLLLALPLIAAAHPLPDIPITTSFEKGGQYGIHAVVDPRCFDADPNMAPYLLNKDLAAMAPEKQAALKAKVKQFMADIVTFHLHPTGEVKPDFELSFGSVEDKPLLLPEDPVMVIADFKTSLPADARQYQIKITPKGTFSVLFFNRILGKKVERFQVLFPGEDSFELDLQPLFDKITESPFDATASKSASSTYVVLGAVISAGILVGMGFKRRFQ